MSQKPREYRQFGSEIRHRNQALCKGLMQQGMAASVGRHEGSLWRRLNCNVKG